MEDILRLTLRRRIPLPEVEPGAGAQPVTIGGEVHRLSPEAIDVLRWLFDHDPETLHALHTALSQRYEKQSIEAAICELLRFGFIITNRSLAVAL
jgi:hypothetical protein